MRVPSCGVVGVGAGSACRRTRPPHEHKSSGPARGRGQGLQPPAGAGSPTVPLDAALDVNPATVARVRARYVAAGLDAAVYRKPPARQYRRRLDGEQEARLVALTCSAPPEGHKRWTLRLLADRLVALQVVESVSY